MDPSRTACVGAAEAEVLPVVVLPLWPDRHRRFKSSYT